MAENQPVNWDFILGQITQKKLTPIISNGLINSSLFGGQSVVRAWAESINYPFEADRDNLTRVAQFLSVTTKDPLQAKSDYLRFLNRKLLEVAATQPGAETDYLAQVRREARGLTFSQLAIDRLKTPNFAPEADHPLCVLASLDIQLYLTTSQHRFIEAALEALKKTPRTEVYCWREGLAENILPEWRTNLDYEPTVKAPLVYHLHGLDDHPDSLVLTEDDHLEFLVNVTQDIRRPDVIPSTVRNALSNSLLLLLGYDLHAWDLRVLLQGLIRGRTRRSRSFAIQLEPSGAQGITDTDEFCKYLQEYFDQIQFNVYWGDPYSFTQELWTAWEQF